MMMWWMIHLNGEEKHQSMHVGQIKLPYFRVIIFYQNHLVATRTDNLNILKAIANIGMQLSDGELLQLVNVRLSETSESNYFTIIRKKTALLFSTCAEVGGLSVNADENSLEYLRKFGEYLGICFQLKDDIFDYSENTQLGKPTGNDIRDGKITLPLIYALQHADEAEKNDILSIMSNNDFSSENIQIITRFTHNNGGVNYAASQMEIYKNKAIEELNGFANSDVKKSLILCAELAASREM